MISIHKIYVSTSSSFFWIAQQLALSNGWQMGNRVVITKSSNLKWMVFNLYQYTVQYIYKDPDIKDRSIIVAKSITDILPYITKIVKNIVRPLNTFGNITLKFGSITLTFKRI